MTTRTLPLVLAAALVAAACASTVPVASGPDRPVSTSLPSAPSGTRIVQKPEIVATEQGLRDVTPLTWLRAIPSPDGRTLMVTFWGGPCMGIDHVGLDESPSTVTITLYQGTPPSLVGSACPEIAMLMAVRVPLSAPLAARTLVDGSA